MNSSSDSRVSDRAMDFKHATDNSLKHILAETIGARLWLLTQLRHLYGRIRQGRHTDIKIRPYDRVPSGVGCQGGSICFRWALDTHWFDYLQRNLQRFVDLLLPGIWISSLPDQKGGAIFCFHGNGNCLVGASLST